MESADLHFNASWTTFNYITNGNGQTLIPEIRNEILAPQIAYDSREEFTLSDGGKINLDFKGKPGTRDLVFLLCGLTAESKT